MSAKSKPKESNMTNATFLVPIEVNVDRPEDNGHCKIFRFQNKQSNKIIYDGFDITMEADLRDLADDKYDAQLISSHEVLVQVPAYSYTWLHDIKEYNGDQKCQILRQAHGVNRNAVSRGGRDNILLLYIFKEELTNVFVPEDVDAEARTFEGKIQGKLHFWPVNYTIAGANLKSFLGRISWLIAVKEPEAREAEVSNTTKKAGLSQLERMIAGMDL